MTHRHSPAALVALFSLALLTAAPAAAQAVKVGSKNFTEQYVIGEMYAAALEAAGMKVERKINLGATGLAQAAMVKGEIDLYPEYTGTGLTTVLKQPPAGDADAVYRQVKAFYEKEFNMTWLKPSNINNGYAMLVRTETAKQHNLKTLSDLARVAKTMSIGASPEFGDRADGLPVLKQVYGIEFADFRRFSSFPLRYKALEDKQVDVANGFSTDWQIAAGKHVVLVDDKSVFPPYYLTAVVRQDALAKFPMLEATLLKVQALIDNPVMQELNRQVEVDKKEPRAVAMAFLKSKGLAN